MRLLIDIGNTRLKWAEAGEQGLQGYNTLQISDAGLLELLADVFSGVETPQQIVVANVAGEGTANLISEFFINEWKLSPVFITSAAEFSGLKNGYNDVSQLGVDRWVAMVAAWQECRSAMCVVSCGTAMTIDLVDDQGAHTGGYIIPGLDLMRQALASATSAIETYTIGLPALQPGLSTADCVRNGTSRAAVSMVNGIVAEARSKFTGDLACKVTGGGAEELLGVIDNQFEIDNILVLKGLDILSRNLS